MKIITKFKSCILYVIKFVFVYDSLNGSKHMLSFGKHLQLCLMFYVWDLFCRECLGLSHMICLRPKK